jgi:hypothetical protein
MMEVPAAGMGSPGPERALANSGVVPPANLLNAAGPASPVSGDSVAALLSELSQSDLTRLLDIVDAVPRPGDQAQVEELLRAATAAVAVRNTGQALDLLRQLAGLDPALADTLVSIPALASIRTGLEQLLSQLTAAALLHAEGKLTEAGQKLETATLSETSAGEVRPEIFLQVATGLIESGGLANYVRSAAVSDALMDPCRWAPAPGAELAPVTRAGTGRHVSWQLPIALWLASGLAAAGLCWWLRDEYLPLVCGLWAGGLLVWMTVAAAVNRFR